jgi:hypothetical protein
MLENVHDETSPLAAMPLGFARLFSAGVENRRQALARTTLMSGSPAARRRMFSAMTPCRRLMVPFVHPDICGVITTLGSSWKGRLAGKGARSTPVG